MRRLFTSESVTEGHPDKVCDQISDAVLDALLAQDPQSRVACETFATTGIVTLMGEITTEGWADFNDIARKVILDIGYDSSEKYHMGLAKSVQVILNEDYYDGETTMEAEIVAFEASEDIAVLKVKTDRKLTVAEFGNSDDLQVGEAVVAIGNPLGFELFGSVTTGIVSALDREVTINDQKMRLIQTDTAINAGNSGGPLINCYGQVIGINSSKISSSYYGNEASVEGLCFAIPMTHAQKVINDLINYGYVTGKPQIGIVPKDVDELTSQRLGLPVGVLVRAVSEGSPAEEAGIKVFDVIIAVDGKTVTNYEELKAEKDQHEAGDTITLTVSRDGIDLEIPLTLAERGPENQ